MPPTQEEQIVYALAKIHSVMQQQPIKNPTLKLQYAIGTKVYEIVVRPLSLTTNTNP